MSRFRAAADRDPLQPDGYAIFRRAVPDEDVDRALRLLNLEIARSGLDPLELEQCSQSTYFPHLRWEDEVLAVRAHLEPIVQPRAGESWADAQLLLRFPDEAAEWPLEPHVDDAPPWAGGRTYRIIAGVALSRSAAADGGLVVWPGSHTGTEVPPEAVELERGDVIVMDPALRHCSTLNRGGSIRYALYFRLLGPPAATDNREAAPLFSPVDDG